MALPILASLLAAMFSFLHPFHVSVTEIQYQEKEESLQITHRIFLDDLELGLRNYGYEDADLYGLEDEGLFEEYLTNYLGSNFKLKINGKLLKMKYVGKEIEEDAIWCYMEVNGVKKVDDVEVGHTLLLEIYEDQSNLVHVYNKGEVKSLRLTEGKTFGKVNF